MNVSVKVLTGVSKYYLMTTLLIFNKFIYNGYGKRVIIILGSGCGKISP